MPGMLRNASSDVGLKISISKTNVMTNLVLNGNISFKNSQIMRANSYVYLGHEIRIGRDKLTCEMNR